MFLRVARKELIFKAENPTELLLFLVGFFGDASRPAIILFKFCFWLALTLELFLYGLVLRNILSFTTLREA